MKIERRNLTIILACVVLTGLSLSAAASEAPRREVRFFGPVGGAEGQTLRVAVAALPTGEEARGRVVMQVEIFEADR